MNEVPTKNRRKIARIGSRGRRSDSAANARPHKVSIGHGGTSRALMYDPLDLRTRVGKEYHAHKQGLAAHLGGDPTVPQQSLIDQAARLNILSRITWAELTRNGVFTKNGALRPAVTAYIDATKHERDVLRLLGLQRHQKPLPTLDEYLKEQHHDED